MIECAFGLTGLPHAGLLRYRRRLCCHALRAYNWLMESTRSCSIIPCSDGMLLPRVSVPRLPSCVATFGPVLTFLTLSLRPTDLD